MDPCIYRVTKPQQNAVVVYTGVHGTAAAELSRPKGLQLYIYVIQDSVNFCKTVKLIKVWWRFHIMWMFQNSLGSNIQSSWYSNEGNVFEYWNAAQWCVLASNRTCWSLQWTCVQCCGHDDAAGGRQRWRVIDVEQRPTVTRPEPVSRLSKLILSLATLSDSPSPPLPLLHHTTALLLLLPPLRRTLCEQVGLSVILSSCRITAAVKSKFKSWISFGWD